MSINPKISVVTVCYNAVKEIEKTILSVLNQTYPNIEYIVIDGGSTDGTVDVIKKYVDRLAYWVSEPDKGIYDAMNKGIKVATGEWIGFLNAGDWYYKDDSLDNMINKHHNNRAGVIYGYLIHHFPYGDFVRKHIPLENFNRCMPIGHPATIVRLSLIKEKGFNLKYKIAGDYDMLYSLYLKGHEFESVPVLITVFDSYGGVSNNAYLKTEKEAAEINGYINTVNFKLDYFKSKGLLSMKKILKKVLPSFYKKMQVKRRLANNEYIPVAEFKFS